MRKISITKSNCVTTLDKLAKNSFKVANIYDRKKLAKLMLVQLFKTIKQ